MGWRPQRPYALAIDVAIFLAVSVILSFLESGVIPTTKGGFYCNDPALNHVKRGETISILPLFAIIMVIPIFLLCGVELYGSQCTTRISIKRSMRWYGDYMLGLYVNMCIIESAKTIFGEPRPHFLNTCRPDTAQNCTVEYISNYKCTNPNVSARSLVDSYRSFPSGHAALSIYFAVFLIWYMRKRLKCHSFFFQPFLQVFVIALAMTCSFSRVTDHVHHWWDVLAGGVLGLGCGAFVVRTSCKEFFIYEKSSSTEKSPHRCQNSHISVKRLISNSTFTEESTDKDLNNIVLT